MSCLLCNACYRSATRPELLLRRHAAAWRFAGSRVTTHAVLAVGVTTHALSAGGVTTHALSGNGMTGHALLGRAYFSTDQRKLHSNSPMQRDGEFT